MTCLCYSVLFSTLLTLIIQNNPHLNLLFSHTAETTNKPRPRYDYAASDPGGKILGHSRELFGARSILKPDKDKYLLVPCLEPEKWVEISLLEDILIDEVQLTQGQIYSSVFHSVEIQYSIDYPTDSWHHLTTIELEPINTPQRFKVDSVWVRFLKLIFLSHYGNEYYCTLTQLSVYGSTILQNLSEDFLKQREETLAAVKNLTSIEDDSSFIDDDLVKDNNYCKPSFSYYNFTCDRQEAQLEVYEKSNELKAYFNVFGEMVKHMAKTELKIEQVFFYCNRMEKLQKNFDEKFRLLEKHFALLELQVIETQASIENIRYWFVFFTVLFGIGMLLVVYIVVKTKKGQIKSQELAPVKIKQVHSMSDCLDYSDYRSKTPIRMYKKKHTK